jgi:hypothetical protein
VGQLGSILSCLGREAIREECNVGHVVWLRVVTQELMHDVTTVNAQSQT